MAKRILSGNVVKTSNKTVSVRVEKKRKHPLYNKLIKYHTKYLVHNPSNVEFAVGQEIKIIECRPMSATKHFCVLEQSAVITGGTNGY